MGSVVRTCVGCRERADSFTLVRFVAGQGTTATVVTPDLDRSKPGRGAHLHPTVRCLELATRRRAWGRALRIEGPLDLQSVQQLITSPPNGMPPGAP